MSKLTEYTVLNERLNNLIFDNPTRMSDEKLEMFLKWIKVECDYLEMEQNGFFVPFDKVPKTLSYENYLFLSKQIPLLMERYYVLEVERYIRNSSSLTIEDAASIYCHHYFCPRNIVWVDFGFNVGKEFGGKHPAIILKNLKNMVLIVAPVSSNIDKKHASSNTTITFNGCDMYNMPSMRDRFTNITRIVPISVYRVDTSSKVGSLKKEKYNEIIQKMKRYY